MLLVCSGCFYWPPLVMESNLPPEIQASSPAEGEVLVLDRPRKAFVQVTDADDPLETLEYLWWIDDGTVLSHDLLPNSAGSIVDVALEGEYHGLSLHCRISDSQDDSVEIEWLIQVVEEGT